MWLLPQLKKKLKKLNPCPRGALSYGHWDSIWERLEEWKRKPSVERGVRRWKKPLCYSNVPLEYPRGAWEDLRKVARPQSSFYSGGSGPWPPGGLKGTMGAFDGDPLSFSSVPLFSTYMGRGLITVNYCIKKFKLVNLSKSPLHSGLTHHCMCQGIKNQPFHILI